MKRPLQLLIVLSLPLLLLLGSQAAEACGSRESAGCGQLEPCDRGTYDLDPFGFATHDCNRNGIEDSIDIAIGSSADVNANGVPDECEKRLAPLRTVNPGARGDPPRTPAVLPWRLLPGRRSLEGALQGTPPRPPSSEAQPERLRNL